MCIIHIYIYIYTHTYACMYYITIYVCVYIYIYIYIERERERSFLYRCLDTPVFWSMDQRKAEAVFRIHSGGWKCAKVGVPWRGSVSACLAWGDLFVKTWVYKCCQGWAFWDTMEHLWWHTNNCLIRAGAWGKVGARQAGRRAALLASQPGGQRRGQPAGQQAAGSRRKPGVYHSIL